MNIRCFKSMLLCLMLLLAGRSISAQCNLSLTSDVANISCFGGSNGGIDLSITGGTAPYFVEWSNGSQSEDIYDLTNGVYTVTVTDQLGCTATLVQDVIQPLKLTATAFAGALNCIETFTSVTASATDGTAPYLYLWSSGETGASIWNSTIGTYTVTVIDGNSCTTTASGTIGIDTIHGTADAGPDLSLNCLNPLVTLGGNSTSVGTNYIIQWTGPGITPGAQGNQYYTFPSVTLPGIYTLKVINFQNGCNVSDQVMVGGEGPPVADAGLNKGLSCGGGGQVMLDGSASTQGSQYQYTWTTTNGNIVAGGNTLNPTVDQAGVYTLNVVNTQTNCSSTDAVEVFPGPVLSASAYSVTAVTCNGDPGHANLGPLPGTSPYVYEWSNGATTPGTGFVPVGSYAVTVTDATGCKYYANIAVPQSENPWLQLNAQTTQTDCQGGNLGAINLEDAINAGLPLSYSWSNGATTQDINGLAAGIYTVTVSDQTACSSTLSVEVASTNMFLSTNVTPASACTGSGGVINLSVSGGTSPYTYIWSDGETAEDAHPLGVGTFIVTVVDANGCTSSTSATLGAAPQLTIATTLWPDACGANGGGIDPTVSGGQAPYSYLWSDGSLQPIILNLTAGTYTVTVTDASGCTQTASGTIVQTSGMTIDVLATNASCNGNDGAIDITVTGGFNYEYAWSPGNTTQDISNLPGGTYTVTVTNSASCTETASVTVTANGWTLNAAISADSTCTLPSGAIDLSVTPSGTETYSWSNGATTQDLSGLSMGDYTVTITGNGGCSETNTYHVPFSPKLPLLSAVAIPSICGLANGSIDVSVTDGVAPFSFLWSGGWTTEDLQNIVSGLYQLTVTGANGCTNSITRDVLDNGLTFTIQGNVSPAFICSPFPTGSIALNVQPLGNYSYFWSNGATGQTLNALSAGVYSVTISAGGACTQEASFDVPLDFNSPDIQLTSTNTSCNGADGSLVVTVTGGASPYSFLWSDGATTQDRINLQAGTYTVTLTDSHGCTATANATINQPQSIPFDIVSLSNDCSSESITGPNLPNLSYAWVGPNGFTSTTAAITVSGNGLYVLTITQQNGCTSTNSYQVNLLGSGACGHIEGRVFHDEDENCALDFGEPGLAGWLVRAEGANDTLYGTTNALGQYFVGVPVGTYAMKVLVPNGLWQVCSGGAQVTLSAAGDTISGGDFPVQALYTCPALTVSMGTSQLRRCFADNYYHVEYCNQGSQAAQDAYITVVLDPYLTAISASIPYVDAGSNVLHFDLGNVGIGECGMFDIQVFVGCNTVLGQTHCSTASIYPDTLCAPPSANWSGASLGLSSICSPDSLRFVIKNTGKGTMSNSTNYIVVEDGVMFRQGILQPLMENDSMLLAVPANGSTWRVEVEQEAYHPYPTPVGLSIEGCTTAAAFSTGFVNQFTTPDEPPSIDMDCLANIGSFDPNDKHSYPVGYGADHYIRPGTDIEYLIRFQNTGTDTAFLVRIIDTLSSWLDPATIRFGASSHPYQYVLDGEGVVHFIFENIGLPDSSTNEAASHGFAKFSIKPRMDAPLESLIENEAAIYFDFNDPVITNTTFHHLGVNFVTVGLWQPEWPTAQVIAFPNPFYNETLLEIKGLPRSENLILQVYDQKGRVVREMTSANDQFHLTRGDWPAGIYWFRVLQNGQCVGSGKLVSE